MNSSKNTPTKIPTKTPTTFDESKVPGVGLWRFVFTEKPKLEAIAGKIIEELQCVGEKWQAHVSGIVNFINMTKNKLRELQQIHPGRPVSNSSSNVFFEEFNKFIQDINDIINIVGNKQNDKISTIVAVGGKVEGWPNLIKAFNNLELELSVGGLFSSFSAQIEEMMAESKPTLKKMLPPYHVKQLEQGLGWLEKDMGILFASAPAVAKDVILTAAANLNSLFCQVHLMIDKFASQFDFNLQKLVQEPLFAIGGSDEQSDEKKVGAPTLLSFEQLAIRFRELYVKCLDQAGYLVREECYPYPQAILKQRFTFPDALKKQKESDDEENKKKWEEIQKKCVDIIESEIKKLQDADAVKYKKHIEFLKVFKKNFGLMDEKVELQIKQLEEKNNMIFEATLTEVQGIYEREFANAIVSSITKDDRGVKDYFKPLIEKMRALCIDRDKEARRTNRIVWFAKQKQNNQELIAAAKQAVLAQCPIFQAALEKRKESAVKKNEENWETMKNKCEGIIQKKMDELELKESKDSAHQESQAALQLLKNGLSRIKGAVEDKINCIEEKEEKEKLTAIQSAYSDRFKDIIRSLDLTLIGEAKKNCEPVIEKMQTVYSKGARRRIKQVVQIANQEQHTQELIAAAQQAVEQVAVNAAPPVAVAQEKTVAHEIIYTHAPKLIEDAKALISTIMPSRAAQPEEEFEEGALNLDSLLDILQKCERKFEELLDNGLYKKYFVEEPNDEKVFEVKEDVEVKPSVSVEEALSATADSSWLSHIAQLFKKIKKLANDTKAQQEAAAQQDESATTPDKNLQKTMRQASDDMGALISILQSYNAFRDHPIVRALPPIGALFIDARNQIKGVTAPFANQPLKTAWSERNGFASLNHELPSGLKQLHAVFSSLSKQAKNDAAGDIAVDNELRQAEDLLLAYQQSTSITGFLFNHGRQIFDLVRSAKEIFAKLLTLSTDQALLLARQMNDALRQLFLLFDRLETQFYLKESYFINDIAMGGQSLFELSKLFSDKMTELGYVFKEEERFPYKQAILAQRKQKKVELAANGDSQTKRFVDERIAQAERDLNASRASVENELKDQLVKYKENALKELKYRKEELEEERKSAVFSGKKGAKIVLIGRVIDELTKPIVKNINLNYFLPEERALLLDGRTGELLRSLGCYTKGDLISHMQVLKANLDRRKSNSTSAAKKLKALQALEAHLLLPGFRLKDAEDKLRQTDLKSFEVLKAFQKELLDPLKAIDDHIPDFLIGKKVINITAQPGPQDPESKYKSDAIKKLEYRAEELIEEYKAALIPRPVKFEKARLLRTIIFKLGQPNERSINLKDFSAKERELLLDGRTGKLLRSLGCYSKEDIKSHIDMLTAKLDRQIARSCFFSPTDATKKIAALAALKRDLELKGFRVKDVVEMKLKKGKDGDFEAYKIFTKYKKELLDPLMAIDDHIPDFLIGEKANAAVLAPVPAPAPVGR